MRGEKPNIILRPFEIGDESAISKPIEGAASLSWINESNYRAGPMVTGICNGRIVTIGGIVLLWPGVGEAWSVFDQSAIPFKRYMLLHSRRWILAAAQECHLHRLQATLRTDLPDAWLKHLGFEKEGLLKQFCQDKCDSTMWSMILGSQT